MSQHPPCSVRLDQHHRDHVQWFWTYLFNVEAGSNIHNHPVWVRKPPRNIEWSSQRYKNGPVCQGSVWLGPRSCSPFSSHIPEMYNKTPSWVDLIHSRNLVCAARSLEKEVLRCSSSSLSCLFTELSCCIDSVARSTANIFSISGCDTLLRYSASFSTDLAYQVMRPFLECSSIIFSETVSECVVVTRWKRQHSDTFNEQSHYHIMWIHYISI